MICSKCGKETDDLLYVHWGCCYCGFMDDGSIEVEVNEYGEIVSEGDRENKGVKLKPHTFYSEGLYFVEDKINGLD